MLMLDQENFLQAFLARRKFKNKKKNCSMKIFTLICRFDSLKPSANNGRVSELQSSVSCNNSVYNFSCSSVLIFRRRRKNND